MSAEYARIAQIRRPAAHGAAVAIHSSSESSVQRSDQEIESDVLRNIDWCSRVDGGRISVDVADRLVTLSGFVGSIGQRQCAIEAAWVDDVKLVEASKLTVLTFGSLRTAPWHRVEPTRNHASIVVVPSRPY